MIRATSYLALCLTLAAPVPAHALPHSAADRARFFAICAGRYSALADHEALFDGVASEQAASRRDQFVGLLDAVMPDARDGGLTGVMVLSWRIAAKHAQAMLLQSATFQLDLVRATQSRRRADHYFDECRDGVLDG
ncbi:hypothetical protein LA6_003613 [Marinibacterium anthonyi]|nr:hypothetical protein LA6_003613 [Marinibacterium anthonyi]